MAVFGSLATLRAQLAHAEHFRAAFSYLEEFLRSGSEARRRLDGIPVGESVRTELADGAFGIEQVYRSKPRPECFFESHKLYIDVQAIFAGEEAMEIADTAKLRLSEDRTPGKDQLVYQTSSAACVLRVGAGDGAVFFPIDGHMPCVAIGEPVLIRKVVDKVPVP